MKSFVVIGLGRFGSAIACDLYDLGHEVLAIDKNEEVVQAISDNVTQAIAVDVMDEKTLKTLGVNNFNVAIVAIGESLQASILITVILRDLGVPFIIAKAQSSLHAKVLERVGADKVVFPERDMALRVANNLTVTNLLDYIALSPNHSIMELEIPQSWIGRTMGQLDVRSKYGVTVIAIKSHKSDHINVSPLATDKLHSEDIIVVVGENKRLNDLRKMQ